MTNARMLLAALAGFMGLGFFVSANAVPITINYTADNVVDIYGQCTVDNCQGGIPFPLGPNAGDWTRADTITVDLAPGTYYLAFFVANFANPSSGNPGGFLADISWDGNMSVSSSAWEVTTCSGGTACDFSGWTSATEYAQNGGGIWGSNLGGPVSGISSSAYWLWTANNFSNVACNVEVSTGCTDQNIALRVRIQVPEPSTLALFGVGLLGLGFAARRKA